MHPQYSSRAISLLNSARVDATWKVALSVQRKIHEAESTVGDLSLPWTKIKLANFILFLEECGFKVSSIRTYIGLLQQLKKSNMGKRRKQLVWTIALTLFFGLLCTGEVLGDWSRSFCPDKCLLQGNVEEVSLVVNGILEDYFLLRITSPKTSCSVTVELLANKAWNCTVKNLKRYLAGFPT